MCFHTEHSQWKSLLYWNGCSGNLLFNVRLEPRPKKKVARQHRWALLWCFEWFTGLRISINLQFLQSKPKQQDFAHDVTTSPYHFPNTELRSWVASSEMKTGMLVFDAAYEIKSIRFFFIYFIMLLYSISDLIINIYIFLSCISVGVAIFQSSQDHKDS